MKRTVSAAVVVACGLLLGAGIARAHGGGGEDDALEAKFRAALVSDADAGDLDVGSPSGSFVRIDAEDGGRVKMVLVGVTDGGDLPAAAAGSQLTITGLVNGMPFTKSFAFDLVAGAATVHDTLGLGDGDLLEIQTVAVSSPATGVFAVPGLAPEEDDDGPGGHGHGWGWHHGRGGGHDRHHHGLVAAHRGDDDDDDDHQGDEDGDDDDHGHGGWGRHHGRGHGHHGGLGKFRTSLVGDADAGDYGVDSTSGGFVTIDADKVSMRIAGVTDGTGMPVDHTGNQLIVTGLADGVPFSKTFTFDLVGGAGKVCGALDVDDAEVVEIQTVTLTDGTTVFAVPGFLARGDDGDDDGVPDDEDACSGTGTAAMVSGDGCSLGQRCDCSLTRHALRACLRAAAREVKHSLRGSCLGKACRHRVRALMQERRSVLRSCR